MCVFGKKTPVFSHGLFSVSLLFRQEEFQQELYELGEQCVAEGIPVHILGTAVSETMQAILLSSEEGGDFSITVHDDTTENDDDDEDDLEDDDDENIDLNDDAAVKVLANNNNKKKKLKFSARDQRAWKVVVDYAALKMEARPQSN